MLVKKDLLRMVVIVFAIFPHYGDSLGQNRHSKNDILNEKSNKAIGDGRSDDTRAIQEMINRAAKGDTVYIPEGEYLVTALGLKSDVHIKAEGLLVQKIKGEPEEFSGSRQNSSAPLFRGINVSNVHLSFRAQTINEAIYLSGSRNVIVSNSFIQGDSSKLRSFAGILLYNCEEISVNQSSISHFGSGRESPNIYQPGTAIRILSSRNVSVVGNHIFKNGENGIFMHESPDVIVSNNRIQNNGMSGIQVAFGNNGIEKNYKFFNNLLADNAADAIDINNRSPRRYLDINCKIERNISRNNGFVQGKSTPDGSGIATLINVSGVEMIDNVAEGNNRPALYIESCGVIHSKGNKADNQVEIVLDFEQLFLTNNTFSIISLLSNVKGRKLLLADNQLISLSLPNGIQVDSLIANNNTISNANLNFNMVGNVIMKGNTISSHEKEGVLLIVRANSVHLEKNEITSTRTHAVSIRGMATNVSLVQNVIRAINTCILDDGSKGLKITGNKLYSLKGGKFRHTLVSRNPDGLVLINNEHTSTRKGIALFLEGPGTARIIQENIIKGDADFGIVNVEKN